MGCESILKWGIWDFSKITSAEQFSESIISWLDFNTYESEKDTRTASIAAGIVLPADVPIPINIDGSYGETHEQFYSTALSKFFRKNTTYLQTFTQINRFADKSIVSAWSDCMVRRQGGAFLYLVSNSDSNELMLKVQVSAYKPGDSVNLRIDRIDISDNLEEISSQRIAGQFITNQAFTRLRRIGKNANGSLLISIKFDDSAFDTELHIEARKIPIPIKYAEPTENWEEYTGVSTVEKVVDSTVDQWIEVKAESHAKGWNESATIDSQLIVDGKSIAKVSAVGTFNVSCMIPIQRIAIRADQQRNISLVSTNNNANPNGVKLFIRK